jgi:hypothetical protein
MKIKLELTPFHFEEIIKKAYSIDLLYMLKMIEMDIDVQDFSKDSAKLQALYQSLIRKNLITTENKLTIDGKELMSFLSTSNNSKIVKRKPDITGFDDWWKTYPGTDTFEHKNKSFIGSRTLRAGKDDCRIKIDKILSEGEYTIQDLIEALKFEILQKKENSVKTGNNKLTYMQNSLTYLNQRSYEPFIELIKQGKTPISTNASSLKGVDV